MNKLEIIEKLNKLELDPSKYIVISGASLVAHDIIDSTSDIDLACDKQYYNTIKWPTKLGFFNIEIKYNDVFEISNNLYEENLKHDEIYGYRFMNLEDCLKLKRKTNREKDQFVIKKLKEKLKEE